MKPVLTHPSDTPPTLVAVGSQALPLAVLILIIVCIELVFAFTIFAFARRQEPFWWFLSGVAIAAVGVLVRAFAYGDRNWDRTPHLELRRGTVAFVPSRKMCAMGYATAEALFPTGSILEYHIETGDHYFAGDRGQFLRSSLWIVQVDGTKQRFLGDLQGWVNPRTMATNLSKAGILFRAVKVYDSQTGEHIESDITIRYTPTRQQ